MADDYKVSKLIVYTCKNNFEKCYVTKLTNAEICDLIEKYYINNKISIANTHKGKQGESIVENVLIDNNISYVNTSKKKHSGDFICFNKVMIDVKNYETKSSVNIDKLIFDMNHNNIKYGILLSITDTNSKIEIIKNIIVLNVPNEDTLLSLYIKVVLSYIKSFPDDIKQFYDDSYEITKIINRYMDNTNKLIKLKNSLASVIESIELCNSDIINHIKK